MSELVETLKLSKIIVELTMWMCLERLRKDNYLEIPEGQLHADLDQMQIEFVRRVARAVALITSMSGGRGCLARARGARRMLLRRTIACRVRLGIVTNTNQHFRAHAWIAVGKWEFGSVLDDTRTFRPTLGSPAE